MEMTFEHKFSGMQVYALYHHAPNAAAKARIINEMFESIPLNNRITIAHTEKFPGLLAMMATHMRAEGEPFLLEMTHNSDERVVNAAVIALGEIPATDDTARLRLLQILDGDKNDPVREHAMQALLNGATDFKYVQMAFALPAYDDGFRIIALKWWGKHVPDEARMRCLEVLRNPDSEPLRVTAIQVLGQVGEQAGSHDVFNALVPVTQETSFGARAAAVTALGLIGNKDALPVLEAISVRAPGRIEGLAKDAVKKLQSTD
jgi:hypothetical protein